MAAHPLVLRHIRVVDGVEEGQPPGHVFPLLQGPADGLSQPVDTQPAHADVAPVGQLVQRRALYWAEELRFFAHVQFLRQPLPLFQ